MGAIVENVKAVAQDENVGNVKERVTSWLRGEIPACPFSGFEELDQVKVPVEIVPPGKGEDLEELFRGNSLGITVERVLLGDQLVGYIICASGLVGVTAVGGGIENITPASVVVKPKIPGTSILTMLNYAYVLPYVEEQQPQFDITEAPLVSLIIHLYFLKLQKLVHDNGLRKDYIKLEEELQGKVRGQCMLGSYLGRYIPAGKQQRVPCRYWELRLDCEPNRALRWGAELCLALAKMIPAKALLAHVESMWDEIKHHFVDIAIKPYRAEQVRRLPRSGRFTPYDDLYQLLEIILDNMSFDFKYGKVSLHGFAVRMWEFFEQFVVNVLKFHLPIVVEGPQVGFSYSVSESGGVLHKQNIYLDALIVDSNRYVVDAKWKEAIALGEDDLRFSENDYLSMEDIKIKNTDLFQVVAYGRHKEVQASGAILVYPVLEQISTCRVRTINDFTASPDSEKPFPVYLVGIPVGHDLEQMLIYFADTVKQLIMYGNNLRLAEVQK